MKKRIIALFLTVVMLVSALPLGALAAQPASEEALVDAGDVSIQGTNSFGTMLSQEITESQAETAEESEDFQAGYSVTDLVIEDATATVTYDTMEEALLVVALYTEDGMRMLTSATATVTADATEATVEFTGEMPEYFLASAYLVDTYDLSPLCAAYDTPMYTQEMQELLASTVEDYDADRVLNLDDDSTTNFAVYAESTKIIEAAEAYNTVASIDDENATYIIENADEQITSLAVGDVFVYEYADEALLIAKVAAITIDGTTATITGGDVEMAEVFQIAKIESIADSSDVVVDTSTADEGITYLGFVEDSEEEIMPNAFEGGGSVNLSHKFSFYEGEYAGSNDNAEAKVTASGSLKLELDVSLKYYIGLKTQYIEFKATPKATFSITVTGKLSVSKKLGELGVSPCPGVYIGFTPSLEFDFNTEASFEVTVSTTFGFKLDSGGVDNISKKPNKDIKIRIDGDIFIGINFKPKVIIIDKKIAEASLNAKVGLQLDATTSGMMYEVYEDDDEERHQCKECVSLEAKIKAELTGSMKFLNKDWLKVSIDIGKFEFPLGESYWCIDRDELAKGSCPYYTYRLTATVVDGENNPMAGVEVQVQKKDEQTDIRSIGTTNSSGVAVTYLEKDEYVIKASSGDLSDSETEKVEEAVKIKLKLKAEEDEEEFTLGGILADIIQDTVLDDSYEKNPETRNRYELFDLSLNWFEAKAYCEQLGGHLVTITSAEEQALIQELMESGSKNQYWIGMYRNNGTLVWVTGENISYTNWDRGQPDRVYYNGMYEDYIEIFNVPNTESGSQRFKWNDMYVDNVNHPNPSSRFTENTVGFICEFEHVSGDTFTVTPQSVYPGDYSTEITNTHILKTASFTGLVPNEQYVLLAMKSIEAEAPLASDNLLFIDQGVALEDGTLSFQYVQRETAEISYVVACGASNKDLADAAITFPEMTADGELQVVDPTVVYDGVTLTEGRDYVIVGTVDYTEEGTYTCYIRGIHNYTGLVECTYTVGESAVTYTSASISLAGDIGVNYYAQLSDDIAADEGAYMQFTVAGQTQTVPLHDAVVSTNADGITTYRFTCKVAAKQMTENITGQMYLSDGTAVGEAKVYSVKAYCDAAIPVYSQYAAYANLVDLMEAMLNYGGYSQTQFGYNTANLANAGLDTTLPALTAADVDAYAHGATGSEAGISVASVSLLLESTTTIRFYFNLDGSKSIDDYTFYVDGVETVPTAAENGQYYVDKVNVAAKDLDEMVTVTVGGLTARYCGMSYVRQVAVLYPTYYSEALVNVAKALYAYNQAANAYFA